MALSTRAEWAARLPFCLLGVLGMYARLPLRLALREPAGGRHRRAGDGDLAALRLVSRQAMTDMAFVGPMTMALALGALALFDDEDAAAAAADGAPRAR